LIAKCTPNYKKDRKVKHEHHISGRLLCMMPTFGIFEKKTAPKSYEKYSPNVVTHTSDTKIF
jgi:hypothetical protein